jgi:diadenylate cyclase
MLQMNIPDNLIRLLFKFYAKYPVSVIDIIDILIVAVIVYQILLWFKGARTRQLLRGIGLLFTLYVVSQIIGLTAIDWLLKKLTAIIVITLIIVFQPELRKALERLGRGKLFNIFFPESGKHLGSFSHIIKAVEELAKNKTGALIVIETGNDLTEFLESGIKIDSKITTELLVSIFNKYSPLHDGAVVIQGDRLTASSCLLPLSVNPSIEVRLGTRHRAALGMAENTDAIVIVVSEETGQISLAMDGILRRSLTREALEEKLLDVYTSGFKKERASFMSRFDLRRKK